MKTKTISILVLTLILIGAIGFIAVEQTTFSKPDIYIPQWGHIICQQNKEYTQTFSTNGEHLFEEYWCGSPTIRGYFPDGCSFNIENKQILFNYAKVYLCDGFVIPKETSFLGIKNIDENKLKEDGCVSLFAGTIYTGSSTLSKNLKYNQKLVIIKPAKDQVVMDVRATSYGLFVEENDHLITTADCDVNSLGNSYTTTLKEYENNKKYISGTRIIPYKPLNYVIGMVKVKDSANVINKNGKWIYIISPGYYRNIEKTIDGEYIVDVHNVIKDDSIECVPSQPYCSNDATKIIQTPENKECSKYSGYLEGYYPITGSEQECTFKCIDGVLKKDKCREIEWEQCPPERPIRDSKTNECVGIGTINICGDGVCGYGETYESCPKDCKSPEKCEPTNFLTMEIPNMKPECLFSGFSGWIMRIKIGVALLSGILIFLYLKSGNKKKEPNKDTLMLYAVMSLIVGYLAYLLFWIGLLIISLYVLIKIVLR